MKMRAYEIGKMFGISPGIIRARAQAGDDVGKEVLCRKLYYESEKVLKAVFWNAMEIAEEYGISSGYALQKTTKLKKITVRGTYYYRKKDVRAEFKGWIKKGDDRPGRQRKWDCVRYDRCLDAAAKAGSEMGCGCSKYEPGGDFMR